MVRSIPVPPPLAVVEEILASVLLIPCPRLLIEECGGLFASIQDESTARSVLDHFKEVRRNLDHATNSPIGTPSPSGD